MSNEQKPLTAVEYYKKYLDESGPVLPPMWPVIMAEGFAAQQVAAARRAENRANVLLQQMFEAHGDVSQYDKLHGEVLAYLQKIDPSASLREELARCKNREAQLAFGLEDMRACFEERHIAACEAEKQLEAVKKERDELREAVKGSLVVVNAARAECDEAVKLMDRVAPYSGINSLWYVDYIALKRGLSSGETKPLSPPESLTEKDER